MSRLMLAAIAAAIALFAAAPAFADRAPTAQERTAIENALRAEGFTRWGEIESDDNDGKWDVDDAYAADGVKYDLDLDAKSLKIIKRDRD